MKRDRRRGAAALGAATFLAALALAMAMTPSEEVEAEAPVPAGALAWVAEKNAEANDMTAERIRREGPSAL